MSSLKARIKDFWRTKQVLQHYRKFRLSDPLFSENSDNRGFEDHISTSVSDAQLTRIIKSYNSAKEMQKNVNKRFLVSNEWLPIYERQFGSSMQMLMKQQIPEIRAMYERLFRDPVSTGLHGMPTNMQKSYFNNNISKRDSALFLIDAVSRIRHWQSIFPSLPTEALVRPHIGNPYGIYVDNQLVTPGSEYQHYYAVETHKLCSKGKSCVLELGGGYGGYAYHLKQLDKQVRYIDIDLPEVLAVASFYLMSAFPDAVFELFGEPSAGDNFDFKMMPNFQIETIDQGDVDVIFNSYSLAEMSPEAIGLYVAEFERISPQFLMHVNHTAHAVLGADKFGIEAAGFRLVRREKALWNLGRNLQMDEYEFTFENAAWVGRDLHN